MNILCYECWLQSGWGFGKVLIPNKIFPQVFDFFITKFLPLPGHARSSSQLLRQPVTKATFFLYPEGWYRILPIRGSRLYPDGQTWRHNGWASSSGHRRSSGKRLFPLAALWTSASRSRERPMYEIGYWFTVSSLNLIMCFVLMIVILIVSYNFMNFSYWKYAQ